MRFLVPLDVRGCAHAVIERALWLARLAPEARIDLMTVMPAVPPAGHKTLQVGGRTLAFSDALDEETLALLRGYAILVDKNGALGDIIVRTGAAADLIIKECRTRRPDMVIMGSHARVGLARAVFGSVAESVLRNSGCPVLIEPAGKGLAEHPAEITIQAEAEASG